MCILSLAMQAADQLHDIVFCCLTLCYTSTESATLAKDCSRHHVCCQAQTAYQVSLLRSIGQLLAIVDSCRGTQVDMFSEVAILERFKGRQGMCQLLDYGLSGDDFILVMRHYACSLKGWRDQLPACPDGQLRLYLEAFLSIVSAVQASAQQFGESLI